MSVTTATSAKAETNQRSWSKAVWAGQILIALVFVFAAGSKFAGQKEAVDTFTKIGLGQWLRYFCASCEFAGGLGLVVPRLAGASATGLVGLMVGATVTNVVFFPATIPLTVVLGVALVLIARYRWNQPRSLTAEISRRAAR